VNTGPVVAGDPSAGQNLVTGDTVNTAARLEQAAGPGEILIGEETYGLARDAVGAEPIDPLALKGKAAAVGAFRLLSVRTGAAGHERRLDSPMVGRERPLRMLVDAFEAATADRACHLFTVLGPAGIGKSRLVREFTATIDGSAQVLSGRCLSYGEGIAIWPITEIAIQARGSRDDLARSRPRRAATRRRPTRGRAYGRVLARGRRPDRGRVSAGSSRGDAATPGRRSTTARATGFDAIEHGRTAARRPDRPVACSARVLTPSAGGGMAPRAFT
jgi:hypothetical protein